MKAISRKQRQLNYGIPKCNTRQPILSIILFKTEYSLLILGTTEFTIEQATGIVRTAVVLDYETANSYGPFTVTVSDDVATATATITIQVVDTNLFGPKCTPMIYVASVAEGSAPGK